MINRLAIICLGIFLLLYGVKYATNIERIWMDAITALSAVLAGGLFLLDALYRPRASI